MSRDVKMKTRGLFLTSKVSFDSEVAGGVQICSKELYDLLLKCDLDLKVYRVDFTRRIIPRARIKFRLDSYNMVDVHRVKRDLIHYIQSNGIEIVFLNMSGLVRLAKVIKEHFGDKLRVILFSHGNDSSDFLHRITTNSLHSRSLVKLVTRIKDVIRLGLLIYTESSYRRKYLDGVITISEIEKQIEKWLGAKRAFFLPRVLKCDYLEHKPDLNKVGFVGRLDHPPNYQGLALLLDEFGKLEIGRLKVRVVGTPGDWGKKLQNNYPFVEYLGELSGEELREEAATWSFFLNPIFWYSAGSSIKVSKGISWGIPIVSTLPGIRGYEWKAGNLVLANDPEDMATKILRELESLEHINFWADQTRLVASSGVSEEELASRMNMMITECSHQEAKDHLSYQLS